jgi:alanyl-tRNA synthetase
VELCGGTHVEQSGDIGLLRIISEGSVAAGIRRLEARTGLALIEHLREQSRALADSAALFKASPDQLVERITAAQSEIKELRKALDDARGQMAQARLDGAIRDWNGMRILATAVEGVPMKKLREVAARYLKSGCDLVLLAIPEAEGTGYLAAAGKTAQQRGAGADTLVRALAEALAGKGGGNASMAQGRGGTCDDLAGVLEGVLDGAAAASR